VRFFGSENNEYSMNLSVQDVNQDEVTNLCEGNFLSKLVQSEIGNYQGFEIVFEPPIALQRNEDYQFIAEILVPLPSTDRVASPVLSIPA